KRAARNTATSGLVRRSPAQRLGAEIRSVSQGVVTSSQRDRRRQTGMHWIWFIIVGAMGGVLGRLLHPGRDAVGFLLTNAVGVVSVVVAAGVSGGWLAFLIGIVIAALLVAVIGHFAADRPGTRRGIV